jgi:hypothetical protein
MKFNYYNIIFQHNKLSISNKIKQNNKKNDERKIKDQTEKNPGLYASIFIIFGLFSGIEYGLIINLMYNIDQLLANFFQKFI